MTRREYSGGAAPLTLSSGITASDISIDTTGTATGWPTGATGKFLVVIDRGLATEEKMLCDGRSGNTLTLASDSDRGEDDTAAASHLAGAIVEHVVGAIDLDEANAHINETGDDHHTQYLNEDRFEVAHDVEARHTFGAGLGTPAAASTVSATTAGAGTGDNPAREDHIHVLPAASPRGVVAIATKTNSFALTSSNQDVPDLTVTTTTVANRRYRISAKVPVSVFSGSGDAGHVTAYLLKDGTIVAFDTAVSNALYTSNAANIYLEHVDEPSAGSHTWKVQADAHESTDSEVDCSANVKGHVIIEDIGSA